MTDSAKFAGAESLVYTVRADQVPAEFSGDDALEFTAGEAFVADDDLPGADEVFIVARHRFGGFAFPDLRVCQPSDDGHAVRGADQVEPESPKVSGVRGAVSVASIAGQV